MNAVDRVAPVLLSANTADDDADGRIDARTPPLLRAGAARLRAGRAVVRGGRIHGPDGCRRGRRRDRDRPGRVGDTATRAPRRPSPTTTTASTTCATRRATRRRTPRWRRRRRRASGPAELEHGRLGRRRAVDGLETRVVGAARSRGRHRRAVPGLHVGVRRRARAGGERSEPHNRRVRAVSRRHGRDPEAHLQGRGDGADPIRDAAGIEPAKARPGLEGCPGAAGDLGHHGRRRWTARSTRSTSGSPRTSCTPRRPRRARSRVSGADGAERGRGGGRHREADRAGVRQRELGPQARRQLHARTGRRTCATRRPTDAIAGTILQAADGARPVLTSAATVDTDNDGRLDRVATGWSEPLVHADDSSSALPRLARAVRASRASMPRPARP